MGLEWWPYSVKTSENDVTSTTSSTNSTSCLSLFAAQLSVTHRKHDGHQINSFLMGPQASAQPPPPGFSPSCSTQGQPHTLSAIACRRYVPATFRARDAEGVGALHQSPVLARHWRAARDVREAGLVSWSRRDHGSARYSRRSSGCSPACLSFTDGRTSCRCATPRIPAAGGDQDLLKAVPRRRCCPRCSRPARAGRFSGHYLSPTHARPWSSPPARPPPRTRRGERLWGEPGFGKFLANFHSTSISPAKVE